MAFECILKLRILVKDVVFGQQATFETNFRICTLITKKKEYFISLNDDEFCDSYNSSLLMDELASTLCLFFMGNEKQWKNEERKLNKMNIGLNFNALLIT